MFDFKMATSKHILDKSAQKNPKPRPNLHKFPNAGGGEGCSPPPPALYACGHQCNEKQMNTLQEVQFTKYNNSSSRLK